MKLSALLRPLAALALLCAAPAVFAQAQPGLPLLTGTAGGQSYSLPVQTLVFLTSLGFLPAILLMMSSFTRIIIVLSLLRHALGTQTTPPNQVLIGLALFLTFFVMSPVLDKVYTDAYLRCATARSPWSRRSTPPPRRCASSCSSRPASPISPCSPRWATCRPSPARTRCRCAR